MSKQGPIVIVEDDYEDQDLLRETLESLEVPNELIFFERCIKAFKYLKTTIIQPFLILCDVNLPEVPGTEFRKMIFEDSQLRKKSIPFVFFTTSNNQKTIEEAYKWMVQGYFVKPFTTLELTRMIKCIIDYWSVCKHPNDQLSY